MLGFGFNKAKVLSAAEKYVQQGKLQNAITEYLKVIKEDPKDLTVQNTIGDLYSRLGQTGEAVKCFQKVGDVYAQNGFTVKAIAMYKKLTKLSPSAENAAKLAELYTQQGLYNDARAQYMQVAELAMKSGDYDRATGVLQKTLELDPDNANMQRKLADLYIKQGKKSEARDIFFNAAQALYMRGAAEHAGEALDRALALDPENSEALVLRGQIASAAGNAQAAVDSLERIANLDSRPDALTSLLHAKLQLGQREEAPGLAAKLLAVHGDLRGWKLVADAALAGGDFEEAIRIYEEHADKFLSADPTGMAATLQSAISKVKENAPALEQLHTLLSKAGATTHLNEVKELLAHACAQAGDLDRARDLYSELAKAEPENPLHIQNYRQIVVRTGQDAAARPLNEEQGGQALMVDELEQQAPALEVQYSPELADAIRQALTDSELFSSYNVPAKAITPLEEVLPQAPRDPQVNQRLASLYARDSRYAEAAACCDVLSEVYSSAGYGQEAGEYAGMAAKYHSRAAELAATQTVIEEAEVEREQVVEFDLDAGASAAQEEFAVTPSGEAVITEFSFDAAPAPVVEMPPPAEFNVQPVSAVQEAAASSDSSEIHEFDLSGEWDSVVVEEVAAPVAETASLTDVLEEARFYLSQNMFAEAEGAVAKARSIAPASVEVAELAQQLLAAQAVPQEFPIEVAPEPVAAAATAPAIEESDDLLGDLVADLEDSLPADFGAPPPPAREPVKAAAAAASAAPVSVPVQQIPAAAAQAVPAMVSAAAAPQTAQLPKEEISMLADLFDEFKEEVEEQAPEQEDPDTHYNLGVAFREMGLLDEAIGELQKVCHAVERGVPFSQTMQAYTWLAQCFVDKGAPQAAIRWYQSALKMQGIDESTKMAVLYDMATAHEVAGDKPSAVNALMQVYGSNIDYRDVAERIKELRA